MVGDPETVAKKILAEHESLGGLTRLTVLLDNRSLQHAQIQRAIELLGTEVSPMVRRSTT
jgi:alkanesulfonate monooxygenase SsuD/methylene tetrahydromethanopterin reductase-like flavin-dependent oxidoreductase (luciferase family)